MIASTRGSSQAACMRRQHHSLAQRCVRVHATAAAQPPPTLAPDAYVCLVRLLWTSDRIQLRLQHASHLNQQPEASTLRQLACASTQALHVLRQRGLAGRRRFMGALSAERACRADALNLALLAGPGALL